MSEKRPYVSYVIRADIDDKGIAYTIKRAVLSFLEHHGLEGKVSDFKATSNRFEANLLIYKSDKPDLNSLALRDYIDTSGKLPSQLKKRPEIEINPTTQEEISAFLENQGERIVSEGTRTDDEWVLAFQEVAKKNSEEASKYQGRIDELEQRVNLLNKTITERQRLLEGEQKKRKSLESRLSEVVAIEFDSALSAIIDGYVAKGLEAFFNIFVDHSTLEENEDTSFLLENSHRTDIPGLFEYVNRKIFTDFKSDEDIDRWKRYMEEASSWENSQQGRKLLEEKKNLEKDYKFIGMVERGEIDLSEGTLKLIKETISDKKIEDIEDRIEKYKSIFVLETEKYGRLEELKKKHGQFLTVFNNSKKRLAEEVEIPIVVHVSLGESPDLSIYVPSFDVRNPLNLYLEKLIGDKSEKLGNCLLDAYQYRENIARIQFIYGDWSAEQKINNFKENIEVIDSILSEDRLLVCLGAKPRITCVKDSS
ncbi:MAG: hypothetical protein AABX73_02295 [Nanoarchaeota archaeon]